MRFWLDKGVDGFRVDAIPQLCEDVRFLDEPLTGNPNPEDYGYTHKIYTKSQPRTYEIVKKWREVIDEYSERVMMMEANGNITHTMKYYVYGAHFPFNFGFLDETNQDSKATDFKRLIDRWMVNMPVLRGTANWVLYESDIHIIIGLMFDKKSEIYFNYKILGFSTNPKTWLSVNKNYVTLNLAAQKKQNNSYYALYKAVSALRKWPAVKRPTTKLTTKLLGDDVLALTT
ncbi:Alpha-glucosidase, partial [Temnothorax longispinosus]